MSLTSQVWVMHTCESFCAIVAFMNEYNSYKSELEEASTHKSAKIHVGNVSVTPDFDFWPFDFWGFLGLILEDKNVNIIAIKTPSYHGVCFSTFSFRWLYIFKWCYVCSCLSMLFLWWLRLSSTNKSLLAYLHFSVKLGDPKCIGFWDIMRRKTDRHTNSGKNPYPRDCRQRE